MARNNLACDDFCWDQVDPFDENDNHLWMKIEHLSHYIFAADFLKKYQPEIVADVSCGMGYGIVELKRAAKTIIGIDSRLEALEIASKRIEDPNIRFLQKDLDNDDLVPDVVEGSVDAVVSFETIEHLIDPSRTISQFSRILKPGGFLICSVPNVLSEPRTSACLPRNKCHKQLFSFGSLRRMIQSHGMQVAYRLGQSWSYTLLKREQQLSSAKLIKRRLSDVPAMHSPEVIRLLSYIVAYPSVEDVDGSYSIIIVARKLL
ncbi:MAG: class I SAM-dependent methyltransferase [Methanotrichaceae archaeon]